MKGIKRDRYGFRAYVKIGTLQREKRFKPDTPIKKMQDWRDETKVALRKLPKASSKKDTFRADGKRYLGLEEIKRLLSFKSRRCEIEAWYPHIGDLPRHAITRAHMLDTRSAWLAAGIAPKTVNHRVRALRHLYRLLDGSKAPTPADDLERLKEPEANPQFVPVTTIRRVAAKLTDPKARARFMVLTATGMRPAQLRRAVRTDVDLRKRLWKVRSAKGGNPIPMILTRDMVAAWKAFIAAEAWGAFDGSDYARALYAAGWPKHIRPYNAKHTIALTLANSDAEWEDIKDFFGHTDVKTTRIYTGMVLGRLKGTAAKLEGRLGWK
jgi:site-specific recombinase XerD